MSSTYGVLFILSLLFFIVAIIAARVLFGLAVYNDAIVKGNENPMLWALLVGFLGWIPGIIYLCTRNSARTRIVACPNCGWGNYLSAPVCGRCGAPNPYAQSLIRPDGAVRTQHAKIELIWGIILYVVAITVYVVGIMSFVLAFARESGPYMY